MMTRVQVHVMYIAEHALPRQKLQQAFLAHRVIQCREDLSRMPVFSSHWCKRPWCYVSQRISICLDAAVLVAQVYTDAALH